MKIKLAIICAAMLCVSAVSAAEPLNTVTVQFENELQPTAAAGIGPGMDVYRDGEHLFVLQQKNLAILSIKDPARPVVVGELKNIGNLRQIVVQDDVAYITAREDGLFVVDVSNHAAPKILSHYDTIEFATGIAIEGHFAFVAQRWFGVEIIDISNPQQLRHVSSVRVGEAQSCVVSDGYLYAGAWAECRVAICDVRNPADPKQVAEVKLNGRGDGLCVENGVLYAAYGHHQPGAKLSLEDPRYGAGNGMDLFDVSNPAEPKPLSRVQFAWRYYYSYPDTWRVKLSFPYAYLYHTHNGVFIFDVSNPRQPKELAQIRIPLAPGEKGFQKLKMEDPSGTRPKALPFDPEKVCYSPVCGLEAVDGYLYFTGLFSDLHLLKSDFAKAPVDANDDASLTASGDFYAPEQLASFDLKNLAVYRPGGQVYAAVESDGYIYAACGSDGIAVLNEQLELQKKYPTTGFAMDVQLLGDKLFAAQGSEGLVCYNVNGAVLEKAGAYQTNQSIRQVRVAPNGKFAVVHAGGGGYEILDVSNPSDIRLAKKELGWGGLVYYRQLCNGFIADNVLCGTWCGGRTFMSDLSGDKPTNLPDPIGLLPDMQRGGYASSGNYALLTRGGGYSLYQPLKEGEYDFDLPIYRIQGGPNFYGKPTVRGDVLVACNRIDGDVTLVDIRDPQKPKLIRQFKLRGNPDLAYIGKDYVLIPAGRQGLIKFEL
ncbi:hypothetical protein LOC68_14245 [Blastopirellula sp. JC732]|uniref:LVIVD repeat protein n=1 Tax=Blastopirellula sediminis TaxID=2894196 RepID=A0A9X1MNQ6_9BACT|nr:hypothetical protein [Blastopirellula sediminis]MCC9607157.1 hypothetical protein [Blastopirellula sediminis]MCC9629550.1 hypothetical protein [Blastopirellula sediminis]